MRSSLTIGSVTDRIYGVIRHPSYLGLLVTIVGWSLAFRAGVGLVVAALTLPVVLARVQPKSGCSAKLRRRIRRLPRAHLATRALYLLSASKGCFASAHPVNVRSLARAAEFFHDPLSPHDRDDERRDQGGARR